MNKERNNGGYEVKAVKTFMGMDCPGYNATLYRGKKKVAFVIDNGNGGCLSIHWVDVNEERIVHHTTNYKGEPHSYKVTPEEKLLLDHCASLPDEEFMGEPMSISDEIFIGGLVDHYENQKWLKRQCRTKTLFTTPDCKEGEYRTIKNKFEPRIKEYIMDKYPEAVILNEQVA
jgi:hypothetical protein